MFPSGLHADDTELLTQFSGLVDRLAGLELGGRSDEQLLELWRQLEVQRNRLAPIDHAIITEVTDRRLDFEYGARNVAALARQVLRVDGRQADARVKAAAALGPRRSLTGERLDPIYAQVAEAQARGSVNEGAARVIVDMIEKLPDEIRAVEDVAVQKSLVAQAEILDTDGVRTVADRVSAILNPDGLYPDLDERAKHRNLRLALRRDGSGRLSADLTAEATEHVQVMLDHLAAPKPAADGEKDPRTAGQRQHDALLDAVKLLERTEALPDTAGVSASITLTMTAESYATGHGVATTGRGVIIPAAEAIRWAGGDCRVLGVLLNSLGAVEKYSHRRRIFSELERQVMAARDKGCSFPGCDAPPLWTEAHHVTDYAKTGRTTIDDGCLLCGVHHREHQRMGWSSTMINRLPHWIPPRHIDPDQKPIRNTTHDPVPG